MRPQPVARQEVLYPRPSHIQCASLSPGVASVYFLAPTNRVKYRSGCHRDFFNRFFWERPLQADELARLAPLQGW